MLTDEASDLRVSMSPDELGRFHNAVYSSIGVYPVRDNAREYCVVNRYAISIGREDQTADNSALLGVD